MTLTQTEIVGFIRNFLELLLKSEAALVAAGINVRKFVDVLTKELETAVAANATQESLKRQLKESTVVVEETHAQVYRTGSTYLDAVIGAVGKTTIEAKNFQRLRSRIRAPGDQTTDVPTPGDPAKETVS